MDGRWDETLGWIAACREMDVPEAEINAALMDAGLGVGDVVGLMGDFDARAPAERAGDALPLVGA